MKKDKINILSIIGLITSFFSIIIGSILCFVALSQIKNSKERGKGLAIAGITINIVKTFSVVLVFILLILAPGKDANEYKCNNSNNCTLNPDNLTYTCIFDREGVEEYITCKKAEQKNIENYGTEDNEDTFDYDREDS